MVHIIEKLIVPIFLGVLVFVTTNTSNKIMSQQTGLIEIQNEHNIESSKRQLELKYLELFYNDINSDNLNKQSNAVGLLRLMNPELGLQLSRWIKMNINLTPKTKEKVEVIDRELMNIISAEELTNKGINLAKRGKIREAITNYNKAIELNSYDFESYNYKGYSYYRLGELSKAEKALRKSISIKKDFIWAHYNLSLVLWKKGKYNKAIDETELVLSIDKDFINVIKKDVQFNKFKTNSRYLELIK